MRNQNANFLALAGKVAAVHDQISKEKEHFIAWKSNFSKQTTGFFLALLNSL